MIDATEARKGITIELDGQLYIILDYQHIKIGRGSAQVKLRLRDIRAGHTIERTFQAGDNFKRIRLEQRSAQYLYQDGDLYYFMDNETFDQTPLTSKQLGDALNYIREGMTLMISRHGEEAVGIELPITVELTVTETGPSFKGDTSQAGTKPAVLETGITIQVPYFVSTGDVVRVDTRDGSYLERA
ncbi:MAG: elongation factor P [Dehalococcoidia bacterium]|nr:MAG: elongation factor P [Dehalococcoidia bacterium]UCG83946.1 MAG: elongation factor P [Dehalococcoidia bacterium]